MRKLTLMRNPQGKMVEELTNVVSLLPDVLGIVECRPVDPCVKAVRPHNSDALATSLKFQWVKVILVWALVQAHQVGHKFLLKITILDRVYL